MTTSRAGSARADRWRVLVVDDEPPARDLLRELLAVHSDLDLVGEAADGDEALRWLTTHEIDVVFLDIRMPERNGFEVLGRLSPDRLPEIVFVTAFDRYAVRAFEVAAVDYLLKPYDRERLDLALGRVRRRLEQQRGTTKATSLERVLERLEQGNRPPRRLFLRVGERVVPVGVDEVRWFEAHRKLVRVHAGLRTLEVRDSLKRLEDELDGDQFVRVSRSALVNLERVVEIQRWFHGELILLLDDGSQVPTTRRYRSRVEERIGR
ncbi:MAG: LytTR family DNA-binding domain-containing protein [Acidobacteriota bacterium]